MLLIITACRSDSFFFEIRCLLVIISFTGKLFTTKANETSDVCRRIRRGFSDLYFCVGKW